jgi:hypothetical protein
MSRTADFDWQILMEATIVPPAERFSWNEPAVAEETSAPRPSGPSDLDARHESHRDGGVILAPR